MAHAEPVATVSAAAVQWQPVVVAVQACAPPATPQASDLQGYAMNQMLLLPGQEPGYSVCAFPAAPSPGLGYEYMLVVGPADGSGMPMMYNCQGLVPLEYCPGPQAAVVQATAEPVRCALPSPSTVPLHLAGLVASDPDRSTSLPAVPEHAAAGAYATDAGGQGQGRRQDPVQRKGRGSGAVAGAQKVRHRRRGRGSRNSPAADAGMQLQATGDMSPRPAQGARAHHQARATTADTGGTLSPPRDCRIAGTGDAGDVDGATPAGEGEPMEPEDSALCFGIRDNALQSSSPLSRVLQDIVTQVMQQATRLQEGRRVIIHCAAKTLDSSRSEAGQRLSFAGAAGAPSNQQRSLLNRALRHMSRILPGCAWTVNSQGTEAQVHVADMALFDAFYKEKQHLLK